MTNIVNIDCACELFYSDIDTPDGFEPCGHYYKTPQGIKCLKDKLLPLPKKSTYEKRLQKLYLEMENSNFNLDDDNIIFDTGNKVGMNVCYDLIGNTKEKVEFAYVRKGAIIDNLENVIKKTPNGDPLKTTVKKCSLTVSSNKNFLF